MSRAQGFRAAAVVAGLTFLVVLANASGAAGRTSADVRVACAGSSVKMVCYHVQMRRQSGLAPLRRSYRLDRAARLKADRMIRCHRFTHEPCGDSFVRTFRLAGYVPWRGGWAVGENLASGWETPWGAFQGLMHSPTHRANILDRSFREIGVSARQSPWGPLWVVEYGRHW
jgi:uncharacterized protein YkwD